MTRSDQTFDVSPSSGLADSGPAGTGGAGATSEALARVGQQQSQQQQDYAKRINVGSTERAASVAGGAILALFGLKRGGVAGLVTTALGGALLHRGATGHCYANQALGINSNEDTQHKHGIHIEQAFLTRGRFLKSRQNA